MAHDLNDIADRLNDLRIELSGLIDNSNENFGEVSGQIEYLSARIDELSGIVLSSSILPEIYYIEEFEDHPEISGIYVDHDGLCKLWTGEEYENLSLQVVTSMTGYETKNEVPTTVAVAKYVSGAIKNAKPEVFYIETFDIYTEENTPDVSGFYIDDIGETRFWTGLDWEYTSHEMVTAIDHTATHTTIPTTKAVYDYVSGVTENAKPEVFYIDDFNELDLNTIVTGFYINQYELTRFWNGSEWEYTSKRIITSLLSGDIRIRRHSYCICGYRIS